MFERVEDGRIPGDKPGVEQRVARDAVGAGNGDGLGDGAGGVAGLEVDIPELADGEPGDALLQRFECEAREPGVVVENHQVNVAERAQFAATVSAVGCEGDGGLFLRCGVLQGAGEELFEEDVNHGCAPVDEFEAGHTLPVVTQEDLAFEAQELFGALGPFPG